MAVFFFYLIWEYFITYIVEIELSIKIFAEVKRRSLKFAKGIFKLIGHKTVSSLICYFQSWKLKTFIKS